MVALSKEQKAISQWDYVSMAVDAVACDGDARGPFARVPSQTGNFSHQVRFVEPTKGKPEVTHCTCQSFKYRKACIHCDIVALYFEMISDQSAPIYEEVADVAAPAVAAEMDALVAQLEKDFGLVEEVAPVAPKPKKVRRSAKNEKLIAELRVAKKVGIALVRKAMSNDVTKVIPECPLNVSEAA